MSDYVSRVSADLQQRYAGQPEYLQAVQIGRASCRERV